LNESKKTYNFDKPCKFLGCKNRVFCNRPHALWCPEHKKQKILEAGKKAYRKRRLAELRDKVQLKCRFCKCNLPPSRSKYCSRKCYQAWDLKTDNEVSKVKTVIQRHEDYIKLLHEKIYAIKSGVPFE
jgi:hypothetical protein